MIKHLWSWKEVPENNVVGLKELFRNEENSELVSQKSENERNKFPESIKMENSRVGLKSYGKGSERPNIPFFR